MHVSGGLKVDEVGLRKTEVVAVGKQGSRLVDGLDAGGESVLL